MAVLHLFVHIKEDGSKTVTEGRKGASEKREIEATAHFADSAWPEVDEALARFLDWIEETYPKDPKAE